MQFRGIDISSYQGVINIPLVVEKNKLDFVILRGGYTGWGWGTTTEDKYFEANYKMCKDNGINVGYYYLTIASSEAMVENEFRFIMSQLKGKDFNHIIGIDVENCTYKPTDNHKFDDYWMEQSAKDRTKYVAMLAEKLQKAGYYVVIYCNRDYAVNKLESWLFDKYDFWYARYITSRPTEPRVPKLWQYSSVGRLTGYPYNLDMNYAFINYPEIIKNNNLNNPNEGVVEVSTEPEVVEANYEELYKKALEEIEDLTEDVDELNEDVDELEEDKEELSAEAKMLVDDIERLHNLLADQSNRLETIGKIAGGEV